MYYSREAVLRLFTGLTVVARPSVRAARPTLAVLTTLTAGTMTRPVALRPEAPPSTVCKIHAPHTHSMRQGNFKARLVIGQPVFLPYSTQTAVL